MTYRPETLAVHAGQEEADPTTNARRIERHSENALRVAQYLEAHESVSWVSYPGLESSPYKAVADRIFTGRGYGGLVSFGLKSGRDGSKRPAAG